MTQKTLKDYLFAIQDFLKKAPLRTKVLVACAVVLVFLLCGGLIYGINSQRQSRLHQIFAQASQVDSVIVDIDEVLTVALTDASIPKIEAAQKELVVAQRQIANAIKSAEALKKKTPKDEQKEVELVQNSLGVREYILSVSPDLLLANLQAAQALEHADAAWTSLENGVRKSKQAQEKQANPTRAALEESIELNRQAQRDFSTAQSALESATAAFSEADFSPYMQYIEMSRDLATTAIEADQLLLKKQDKAAKQAIKKYNKLSKDAAVMAHENIVSLNSVIMAAYRIKTEALSNQYFSAREKVSSIDKQIR